MNRRVIAVVVILVLVGGSYLVFTLQKKRAQIEAEEEMRQARADMRRGEAEIKDAYRREMAELREEKADLAERLAGLAAKPESEKPSVSEEDGDLEIRVYSLRTFEHAELHRVKGHPEAWSWLLISPQGVSKTDFGPPGSVRDLMAGKEPVHGIPVAGLLYTIEAGPLKGAVLVYSPPMYTGKASYQIATVEFHQKTPTLLMEPLCDFGLVPGRKIILSTDFKNQCHAAVAKRLGYKTEVLFPSPWLKRAGKTEPNCDRVLTGVPDGLPGRRFTCRWDSTAGKMSVKVNRK